MLKGGYSPDVECFLRMIMWGVFKKELLVQPKNSEAVKTAELLNKITEESYTLFEQHPVNLKRREEGKDIANMLWFWSPQKTCHENLYERFNNRRCYISGGPYKRYWVI